MGANQGKPPSSAGPVPGKEREVATTQLREYMIRKAINEDITSEMQQLVKYIDPDACLASGECLLIFAMKHGSLDVVKLLIKQGADLNKSDETGSKPLHTAVLTEKLELVNVLLESGASVDDMDNTGLSSLHLACNKGNAKLTKTLLEAGAKPNQQTNNSDKTCALIIGSTYGQEECVKELLEHGADPDLADKWGFTSLSKATINSRLGCVHLLLSHRADLNIANQSQATPVQYAAIRNHCDILKVLTEHNAEMAKYNVDILPLAAAALNGCYQCAEELLQKGSKTEWTDRQNKTALYYAMADKPKIEHLYNSYPLSPPVDRLLCSQLLIQHGADVSKLWRHKFWETRQRSQEQIASYKLAIRAFGFADVSSKVLRSLCHKLTVSGCHDALQLFCVAGYLPESGALNVPSPSNSTKCHSCSYESDEASKYCIQLTGDKLDAWLQERTQSPLPLKHLCRLKIRSLISYNVIFCVKSIPLTEELRNYICITEHISYS